MGRSLQLRRWQKDALDALEHAGGRDFLTVATPGAGKTTFALAAALMDLKAHPHRRVIVVTPTRHLKHQWADAAAGFGLRFDAEWSSASGLPADVHGALITYQQAATSPRLLRAEAEDAFVVLDEIHHAGSDRAWGSAIAEAFEPAARRLALSGTPFRSDQDPIPFVRYEYDEAVADHSYGYGEALTEGGVVRPVFFPALGGHMEWEAPDGNLRSASFDDPIDRTGASQRLRTALSPDGEWLPTVLREANGQLARLRQSHPDAGGLAIAMDVDHARAIQALLDRLGAEAEIATNDDPAASERISTFAASSTPWIVAVRMVSEGVDIPRLRVGVYATNVVTELFFRQAVGRLVRWHGPAHRQKAFMFVPDDVRLRTLAHQIMQLRTHSLARREAQGRQLSPGVAGTGEDQLSLFAAIAATPHGRIADVFDDDHPEDLFHVTAHDPDLTIELADPPRRGVTSATATVSWTRRRRELRQANTDRARMISHLSGLTPDIVHARLNDAVGIVAVADATVRDLELRVNAADRWIDQL